MRKMIHTIDNGIGHIENIVSVLSLVLICIIAFVQVSLLTQPEKCLGDFFPEK